MLYLQYGCASCHGLSGTGAVVAPELLGEVGSLGGFFEDVREGPKEMPGYASSVLTDDNLELIHRFLNSGSDSTSCPLDRSTNSSPIGAVMHA
jgi:mono/diheme cytochrome c family protein